MSDQVFRYKDESEYLDPEVPGTPVSAKLSWDEAVRVRDLLREGESRYYYNIVHLTSMAPADG
jgi:hypothetical protein